MRYGSSEQCVESPVPIPRPPRVRTESLIFEDAVAMRIASTEKIEHITHQDLVGPEIFRKSIIVYVRLRGGHSKQAGRVSSVTPGDVAAWTSSEELELTRRQ